MRLSDELDYKIDIEEGTDTSLINIPHSLLYTFVENVIKHGLVSKSGDRQISLTISHIGRQIRIMIHDNGVGRVRATHLQTSRTGKGLEIVKNNVSAYNKLYNRNISILIDDLFQENDITSGTRVIIYL